MVLNYFWLKLGPHELLFDRIQYGWDADDHRQKGRFGFDESDDCRNLAGIRNRIVNVIRYGERLQNRYVSRLNTKLPGFSRNVNTVKQQSRHNNTEASHPTLYLIIFFRLLFCFALYHQGPNRPTV